MGCADFLAEGTVLRDQFLDSLFVGVRLLIVRADFVAVFVELSVEFVHLVGRETKVFLRVSHFSVEVGVFLEEVVDLLFQSVVLLIIS